MKRRRILIVSAVAVAALLALGISMYVSHSRATQFYGTIETREIQIGSRVGGRVTAVPVEEGQLVKAGQVLVRFECDELTAQRQQAAAQVAEAQASLDRLVRGNRPEEIAEAEATAAAQKAAMEAAIHGPRPQELAQAQADYSATQADSANARSNYDRMAQLAAKDIISRQQFGHTHAKVVIEHEHFAAGHHSAVDDHVDWIACQFVERNDASAFELEDILEIHLGSPQLDSQVQIDIFQKFQRCLLPGGR